ncbi:N,N-dimethylformamidase beta subunit family domain-containing protein [Thalassobaculum sp.]|uniref:N,N-dimethylformamidase beta subunit family domain-containing protein n=1 Tax=Thalassobaculum sp. TaxID=2022740 RepID=UPI0032EE71BC
MLALTGYVDRFSAAPGGTLAFKVSSTLGEDYTADLVRIRCADPNPAGPGMKILPVDIPFGGRFPSRFQPVHLGSYGRIDTPAALTDVPVLTLSAIIWPTLPGRGPQAVLTVGDPDGAAGVGLEVGPMGATLRVAGNGTGALATGVPLAARSWYRIAATVDRRAGTVRVSQTPLDAARLGLKPADATATLRLPEPPGGGVMLAAAPGADGPVARHYDGKLETPMLVAGTLDAAGAPGGTVLAAWDLGRGIDGIRVEDLGPGGHHGVLVNLPTRAVTGSRWTGNEMCWRHAPDEYAAVHFHSDDLHDCGWETGFSFTVPDGMPSGIYGARLRCAGHEDIIPFYVIPAPGRPTAKVLFIGSTYTFQAYANHRRGNLDEAFRKRIADWGAYPHNTDDHSDYAHSTYNRHPDDSGVALSSRLRPILTMRPGYLTFNDPRGSGLRHFPADSHVTDWLEAKGIAYDVLTDEDIDEGGAEVLKPYAAVLTGSHPEYHTPGTLDALEGYTAGGGRLCYLGGNGFYWRIARNPDLPGVIEVRRAETGIRAWAAETGEYYQQLDGGLGGLWRRNGRPPQRLAGVGFSSQGLFEGSYYRRLPAADDPQVSWIFAGVPEEIIGDFGLSGGGAAGFELDRAEAALGTPPGTVVLASSEGHGPSFIPVFEDLLSHVNTLHGGTRDRLVRADMIYADLPSGGALFSVGSITFCGSLAHNGYANPVSRILENVVRRFAGG